MDVTTLQETRDKVLQAVERLADDAANALAPADALERAKAAAELTKAADRLQGPSARARSWT